MENSELRKKITYISYFIIIVLFLFTFSMTTSRFLGTVESNDDVVAVPVLTLDNHGVTYTLDEIKLPGDVYEINFKVSNTKDNVVNEVLLNYTFEFTNQTIPLNFELYEITSDNKEVKINVINNVSSVLTMDYEDSITKDYKLKIIWNEEDDSYEYAGKKASFKLNLLANQVV